MMEQTGRRIAGGQRAAESGDGQIALQPVTGGPTDDAARVEVEDHRQIEPALGRPDVGNVRAPFPVRCLGREVLRDEIGRDRPGMLAVRRALEPAFPARDQ